jgi:predicted DCC family thiol-disulfide oxidoreductase YuxK
MMIWQGTWKLARPIVVYDGDCAFCTARARRLQRKTGEALSFAPYQDAAERFPEIPRVEFERSLVFIDVEGRAFAGAQAVYRALACKPGTRGFLWCYRRVPGFAWVSELGYRFIARHRR